jgi:uncharacterized protein YndB with AHSA1/START domain/DNA-binding transcriptional ArsR family regulator
MVEIPDFLARTLAHPLRRAIIDQLRESPATADTLCENNDAARLSLLTHLEILKASGLIAVEQRGTEHWNYLNASLLHGAADRWLSPLQADWAARFSRLNQHLNEEHDMLPNIPLGLDIRQEMDFSASPALVFNALTHDVQNWWIMRQTNPGSSLTLEPRVGASLVERSPDGHEVIWGTLEEVRRPERLYFSGRFAVKGAVAGRVHFDLEPLTGGGCRLILSHQAIGNISEETRNSFNAGWGRLLGQCLTSYLLRAA